MKKEIEITIEKESAGKKIEHILKVKAGLSETLIRRLKRTEGGILLNGKPAKVIEKVSFGDVVKVTVTEKSSQNIVSAQTGERREPAQCRCVPRCISGTFVSL